MENQVSTIVCPNCGASTTNGHNCDFCGSLLVRFVAENKDVDTITFGENAKEMAGLKDALKQNLSYQKIKRADEVVVTNIFNSEGYLVQVVETANCNVGTAGENPFLGVYDHGVALRIAFEIRNEDPEFAEAEKIRLNWFKKQSYYFLFTQQNLPVGVYYYIDFGEDIDNATRLLSSILISDNNETDDYTFETKMVSAGSLSNDCGLIIDKTSDKSRETYMIAIIVSVIVITILSFLF